MPFGRRRNRIDRSLRERGVPPEPQHREREVEETSGPFDEADAPEDGVARIDLGALRLPALPGMELRVDLNQQQKVIGATLRHGDSLLQVSAFAAPRAAGIWDDVRVDLATSASGQGASLKEVDGPFGPELAGTVMAAQALMMSEPCSTAAETKRSVNACVKAVAGLLGNTVAVARSAYIHPAVLEAYGEGELDLKPGQEDRAFELAVLRFLEATRDRQPAKAGAAGAMR